MFRPSLSTDEKSIARALDSVPDWVTCDLLKDTLLTWQPYYSKPLTDADALEVLLNVGRLVDVLRESDG